MLKIIINPGTEPIHNANEKNAIENISHFITDIGEDISWVRISSKDYGDGRYGFLIWENNLCYEIQMPGLPLHNVRFTKTSDQNIRDFPRLYVDGGSWVWCFALEGLFKDAS